MWKLKIEFETLCDAGDFINKIRTINKTEYHIETPNNQILITGENEYCRELTLQVLAETIVNNYKSKYFKKHLKLDFLPTTHINILTKLLIMFDIESDIYFVLNTIENLNFININSYSSFVLRRIKHKWEELVVITNLNSSFL